MVLSMLESHFDLLAAKPARVSTFAIWSRLYAASSAAVVADDTPPRTLTNAYWSCGRGSARSNIAFEITIALSSESSLGALKRPTAFSSVARPLGPRNANVSPSRIPFAFAKRSLTTASLPRSDASDAPSTSTFTTLPIVPGSTPLMPAFERPTRPRSPRTCETNSTSWTERPASAAPLGKTSQPFCDVST